MLASLIKGLFKPAAAPVHDALERAKQLIKLEQFSAALDTLDQALARSSATPEALLLRAEVKRKLQWSQQAVDDLTKALELGANPAQCHLQLSMCWADLGEPERAYAHGLTVRQLDPSLTDAFFWLTALQFPGAPYTEVLERIVAHVQPQAYVEIGIFQGECLKRARAASVIVGIDPAPQIAWPLEPHMKVFTSTSDDFFAQHDLKAELGGRAVDLAFIDGMHQFEFALRDFANLERYAHDRTVVLVHDCYPLDAESAGREPRPVAWSGDVWRMIVLLKKYRPDLLIHTIGAAPTGLAVIQNLDPSSTFLLDNHDRLRDEFLALEYSYLDDDKPGKLNLFPNDWPAIEAMVRR